MNIAILGYGGQGESSYEYWNTPVNQLTICDRNESLELPAGATSQLGEGYLHDLDRFDLLIRTPALHPKEIQAANPEHPDILDKVWSNTNEFMKVCPTRNIIGVTGTKGKGTTSTLITRMLQAAGKTVHLGGNIGTPPLQMLKADVQPDDWVVLELANFQLIDLQTSPPIAVCLMVVPEHMDWHSDMQEYTTAKQQIFKHQNSDNVAIYYADNPISTDIAAASPGKKLPYYAPPGAYIDNDAIVIDGQTICHTDELKILGKHNWQNVCAAVTTVWRITQDLGAIQTAATSFSGLEHRLELVGTVNGVKYFDDSFGTTPETAIVAMEALAEPKVIILGGSDKGASYDALAETVQNNNVKHVVAIGQTGSAIAAALRECGFTNITDGGPDMRTIVASAQSIAEPGDVVLLSTGCASFGMFANYKDRGEQFKQVVQALS